VRFFYVMNLLVKGFLLGFAIAAPVGPIGVLCIRRTLANGRMIGFLSGLGAATADMFYGSVAAFSLTIIQDILVGQKLWLRLIGGIFLIYLGVRTTFSTPAGTAAGTRSNGTGLVGAYVSTVFLTLTNPATIIAFTVIFAGLGLGNTNGGHLAAASLVGGVFLGSASWWLTLSMGIGILRDRFTSNWMVWVNRTAGAIITAFGIATLTAL
jgi:threonine/homoserine/homoserine lactone efflux protein